MPGIVIIKPLEEKANLIITNQTQTRLLKGKVIAIGIDLTTDQGAILHQTKYIDTGDIVYFLSYEGNYDNFIENNEKYYAVKFQDLRCRI